MQGGTRRPENDAGSNLLTENGKRGTGVFSGRNLLSGERRSLPRPPLFEESRIAVRLAAVSSGTPRFRFIDTYCETRERRKSGRIAAKADLPPGRAANPLFSQAAIYGVFENLFELPPLLFSSPLRRKPHCCPFGGRAVRHAALSFHRYVLRNARTEEKREDSRKSGFASRPGCKSAFPQRAILIFITQNPRCLPFGCAAGFSLQGFISSFSS